MSELVEVSRVTGPNRSADVVFVHGLSGDAVNTWRAGSNGFWPKWLADDLPSVGVWSLGYEASPFKVLGSSMLVHDRAVNAIAQLEARGLGAAPTVFVCHSLGGLLVKQMVRHGFEYPSSFAGRLQQATKGIVFLATPHSGSQAATWSDRLLGLFTGPLVNELRANSPQLRDLNQWYRNNASRLGIKHQAYSETRAVGGVMIVDPTSADPGIPNLIPVPLDEDHVSICKPSSRDNLLYLRVRAFVVHFARSGPGGLPVPAEYGPQPTVAAVSALPELNLRRLLAQKLGRAEVAVVWFDTFDDGMDDHLPGKSLSDCVIELLLRARRLSKQDTLYEAIALERPDLAEELRHGPAA